MAQLNLDLPPTTVRENDPEHDLGHQKIDNALSALQSAHNDSSNRLDVIEANPAVATLVNTALTLPSGWTAVTGYGNPSAALVRQGLVHVHGYIDAGSGNLAPAAGTTIATIPASPSGLRPSVQRMRWALTHDGASAVLVVPVLVGTDGTLKTQLIAGKRYWVLDMHIAT